MNKAIKPAATFLPKSTSDFAFGHNKDHNPALLSDCSNGMKRPGNINETNNHFVRLHRSQTVASGSVSGHNSPGVPGWAYLWGKSSKSKET